MCREVSQPAIQLRSEINKRGRRCGNCFHVRPRTEYAQNFFSHYSWRTFSFLPTLFHSFTDFLRRRVEEWENVLYPKIRRTGVPFADIGVILAYKSGWLYCYRKKYASSRHWRTIYVTLVCVDHVTIPKKNISCLSTFVYHNI